MNGLTWLRSLDSATLSIAETARLLGVDERTVSRAIADGQLPGLRVGRRMLVPRLKLLAALEEPTSANEVNTADIESAVERATERAVEKILRRLLAND